MNADIFIESNSDNIIPYVTSFQQSIIYCFNHMKYEGISYCLPELKKIFTQYGHKTIKLEDYLRNDFKKHLDKCLEKFGLENFIVECETSETRENIKSGSLDIKFTSPSLSRSNVYYIIECKILSDKKHRKDYYIDDGIQRFSDSQYYPEAEMSSAGMMAFVIRESDKDFTIEDILIYIIEQLNAHSVIKTLKNFKPFTDLISITKYDYLYKTLHARIDRKPIEISHIWLDYRDIYKDK